MCPVQMRTLKMFDSLSSFGLDSSRRLMFTIWRSAGIDTANSTRHAAALRLCVTTSRGVLALCLAKMGGCVQSSVSQRHLLVFCSVTAGDGLPCRPNLLTRQSAGAHASSCWC